MPTLSTLVRATSAAIPPCEIGGVVHAVEYRAAAVGRTERRFARPHRRIPDDAVLPFLAGVAVHDLAVERDAADAR